MTNITISLRGGLHATIRQSTPEDAHAVLEYFECVAAETDFLSFGAGEYGKNATEQAAQIRAFSTPDNGLMLQALLNDELAGIVTVHRQARPRLRHGGELGVSIRQKYWGLGLGRALCEAAIVEARLIGLTRIQLHVRADNLRAIALYEELGFQLEGRLHGAFKVRNVEYDDLIMTLRLSAETTAS